MEKGVIVTLNTDNMTVSDTTIENERKIIKEHFGFTDDEIKTLLMNSIKAAFISEKEKQELKNIVSEKMQ